MQVRTPAVAGMFYPDKKDDLKRSIRECFLHRLGPGHVPPSETQEKIFGAICPHAGYMYSGPVACHSFYVISSHVPELFIILGPNHWNIGRNISTMQECRWQTPLGDVEVDSEAAKKISELPIMDMDFFSHSKEHSIEVQLPMIQELPGQSKILPISLISQDMDSANAVGLAVAGIADTKDAVIIGSSDFTHYETNEFAHEQDKALIEPILNLDVDQFYSTLEQKNISACGYGAIASTMVACKRLGATEGRLLQYATSGDITGDMDSVVGYGSIVFT